MYYNFMPFNSQTNDFLPQKLEFPTMFEQNYFLPPNLELPPALFKIPDKMISYLLN